MSERPVLFSTDMVRAIADDRKTVTRRPETVTSPAGEFRFFMASRNGVEVIADFVRVADGLPLQIASPCDIGDVLWVREAFTKVDGKYLYKADGWSDKIKWKPSIHMPRDAARLFLKVESVDIGKINDVGDEEAQREGFGDAKAFRAYWDERYARRKLGTKNDPWAWAIRFIRTLA